MPLASVVLLHPTAKTKCISWIEITHFDIGFFIIIIYRPLANRVEINGVIFTFFSQ